MNMYQATGSKYFSYIMPFCKYVMAKVILVPCSVKQLKRDNAGHGEATINNAASVHVCSLAMM